MARSLTVALVACVTAFVGLSGCNHNVQPRDGDLRVVTYNVARGYAVDLEDASAWRALLPSSMSLKSVLSNHPGVCDFDVLALQELCGDRDGAHLRYFRKIAGRSGRTWMVFKRADPKRPGSCAEGVAIISRLPIVASGSILLPNVATMRRTAVWADIRVDHPSGSRIVRVYNVHLDARAKRVDSAKGRALQIGAIIDHHDDWRRKAGAKDASLVVGDFNTLEDDEPVLDRLVKIFKPALPVDTSTHWLGWQLDRVFFDGLERRRARALRIPLSDHYPVTVDFDFPRPSAPSQTKVAAGP